MRNEKEEPIKIKCIPSKIKEKISICEIDKNINLIDNQIYSIYFSENIYNISDNIVDKPIGEFKYVNTNKLNQLYYDIKYFNFKEGIIRLTTSNKVTLNDKIIGYIGPAYDNVAKCYQYKYECIGNGRHNLECNINKNNPNKIIYNGKYTIYSLEGYSFNSIELNNKINYLKKKRKIEIWTIYVIIMIFIICLIINSQNMKRQNLIILNNI